MRLYKGLYDLLLKLESVSRRARREIEWRVILLNGFDQSVAIEISGDFTLM